MRLLFVEAATLPPPDTLAERSRNLADGDEGDLRISALQAVNDALRDALTELHAFVETQEGDAAAAMNAAIWSELSASTQRRAFSTLPF